MFSDPHSVRQLHAADMLVAHQRRTRGKVATPEARRWYRALLAKLTFGGGQTSSRPVTTAYARAQRRGIQSTAGFNLVDASTGQRLDD
jgi:hypothetical protein